MHIAHWAEIEAWCPICQSIVYMTHLCWGLFLACRHTPMFRGARSELYHAILVCTSPDIWNYKLFVQWALKTSELKNMNFAFFKVFSKGGGVIYSYTQVCIAHPVYVAHPPSTPLHPPPPTPTWGKFAAGFFTRRTIRIHNCAQPEEKHEQ